MFSIKTEDNLTDYLGCEFHTNNNKTKGWSGEPSTIKGLKETSIMGKAQTIKVLWHEKETLMKNGTTW